MDGLVRDGTFNIVRRVSVSAETLQRIAEILGIPEDERGQLVSGVVYMESGPSPARGRAAGSTAAGGTTRRRK